MTQEQARAILITAFATTPDLPDDMQKLIARLIMPPKRKKRLWRKK